ncbi:hypothetical protein BU23DRAFT_283706 [Bimuria novae-zelandiae CBS 107.79]|uniref:SAP domain-containing protein n=1 Tax=Bimuria novae-zelandiae CBS 107.79 TaxID=1447943 RepID=A0A6A5URC5_9PLEO|nr:hypothetical protein BU23DRAFT_283706 [Bimuria novae-zelandiae CBS 107.79]
MTDTTWPSHPLWQAFKSVDADFIARFHTAEVKPTPRYDNVRLQILLFAGRQAAAAVRIACAKGEKDLAGIAELAMLYEPFTYFDWYGYDADGVPIDSEEDLEEGKRKRRVLWERERAFRVDAVWDAYPTPRERWEGFKMAVERRPRNAKLVKRIALASWMSREDFMWIADTLTHLEGLDLSDVPRNYDIPAKIAGALDPTWLGHLRDLSRNKPYYPSASEWYDNFGHLDQYLDQDNPGIPAESERLLDLFNHSKDYAYRTPLPAETWRPHEWYVAKGEVRKQQRSEGFQEFFWKLRERQLKYDEETGTAPDEEPLLLSTETYLWPRLKWLGLPDWRNGSKAAKIAVLFIPKWAVALKTVSIRGEYTRDRSANEVESVHNHVCRLILGVVNILPESVTMLELRMSVSFLRFFLAQLQERKPGIERVGIDLGAWVQVFPLKKQESRLKDADIRATTRLLAQGEAKQCELYYQTTDYRDDQTRQQNLLEYGKEQEYRQQEPSFYRDRSGDAYPHTTVSASKPVEYPEFVDEDVPEYYELTKYDFFDDLLHERICDGHSCPLDPIKQEEPHGRAIHELNATRANTLPKMLEKLHLARPMVDNSTAQDNVSFRLDVDGTLLPRFHIKRLWPQLFGLEGEKETRSLDPIHPLTLTQVETKTDIKSGRDYEQWTPEFLDAVYPWLEQTFAWRPVFDWDWFMVPHDMSLTADPNLVSVRRIGKGASVDNAASEAALGDDPSDWQFYGKASEGGPGTPGKALQTALAAIKKQFELLNRANIPVHLLIGRRHPDLSSCYWGWPYTPQSWQTWTEDTFSANLETIAEHVNILSIFYDLRNPLDTDRLSFIDQKRPQYPPEAKCPTRVCPFTETEQNTCPFVQKYPGLRSYHPRPQAKGIGKPPKHLTKPSFHFPKPVYGGLANGDPRSPPTGKHAENHAKDDDSDNEVNEHWPLHLARHSAYTREAVGWQRFWDAYATSFANLTALHVRMPHCMDRARSWRLARLLNRQNGWDILTYTDERQHMQTEEDLLSGFEDDPVAVPASVYLHTKESRYWPVGRFVRRSWVWDPLIVADDRYTILRGPRPDSDPEDEYAEQIMLGKKYRAYRFTARVKLPLNTPDPTIDAGEQESLRAAVRDVAAATAAEVEHCDPKDANGVPVKPPSSRIPQPERLPHQIGSGFGSRLKSVYGHHVRNVAGAQWREELREMIAYADRKLPTLKLYRDAGVLARSLRAERAVLKSLLGADPPYASIFEIQEDEVALRDVAKPWASWRRGGAVGPAEEGVVDESQSTDGHGEGLSGDADSGTDVDSLFVASEEEHAPEPNGPLPPPEHKPSKDSTSSTCKPSSSKKPRTGPFHDSSPSDDEGDSKRDALKISTAIANAKPATYKHAVRQPITPIDEDYTDNDDFDDDGNPTDTERVEGTGNREEVVGGESGEVSTVVKERKEVVAAGVDIVSAGGGVEVVAVAEEVGEVEKVEVVEKVEAVEAAEKEAIPSASSAAPANLPSSSQKKSITSQKERSSTTPKIESTPPTPPTLSTVGQKRKTSPSPTTTASNKKVKISEPTSELTLALEPVNKSSDYAPAPSPKPQPPPSDTKKRKAHASTPASPSSQPPTKKTKTRAGRTATSYKPPSSESDEASDAEAKKQALKKRSHSKADYIPSPTTERADPTTIAASDDDSPPPSPPKPHKKSAGRKGRTSAAAGSESGGGGNGGIVVPQKGDGSGPDYNKMTVKNMRALAKERGVSLKVAGLKRDIVGRFEEEDGL